MKAFLRATARGYETAAADPQKAAGLLVEECKGALIPDFAQKSQEYASKVGFFFQCFACDVGRVDDAQKDFPHVLKSA